MIIKFLTGLFVGIIIFSAGYTNAASTAQIPKSVVSAIVKETFAGKSSNPTAADIKVRAGQVNLFLESVGGGLGIITILKNLRFQQLTKSMLHRKAVFPVQVWGTTMSGVTVPQGRIY